MAVDWSEYPKTYWHCYVRLEESGGRAVSLGVLNDLSIEQIVSQVVEPWREARSFNVGGVVVDNAAQVAEIRLVLTARGLEECIKDLEYEMSLKGRRPNVTDERSIPFRHEFATDYTHELLYSGGGPATVVALPESPPTKAFIVHGHDTAMLNEVALLLERLDIDEIILKDQPNLSRTLIEKLEQKSDVGYAIILFTPDDLGRAKDEKELKPRARQNAVLELGYFIGSLGRKNVCVLLVEGLDRPSDIDGVGYVPIDPQGAWHLKLANEMRAAGLPVDLNKLAS